MAAPKSWTEVSPLVSAQRSINATSRMALLKKVGPALLGNMIEFYEFGIYALVTEAIHENFFGKDDSYGVWIGFGISFVARPFGGFFFGFLADRISRRFALLVSIAGMIIATGGIGLLPTRSCCGEVWGWFGLILLIAFKVTQGLCVGGELTTVVVFCGEHAGRLHAGFGVALAVFTAGLGTVMSELVVLVIDRFLDDEQMMTWGWRIPFLLVFPWGVAAIALRRGLHEPEHGAEAGLSSSEIGYDEAPIKRLWRTHRWHLLLGTLLFAGQHVGFWGNIIFAKSFLIEAGIRTRTVAILVSLLGLAVRLLFSLTFKLCGGVLCDRFAIYACAKVPALRSTLFGGARWGAMRLAPWTAVALCIVVWPLWVLMVLPDADWGSLFAASLFGVLDGLLGISLILIGLELFPVSIRATGLGLSYNIAHALFSSVTPIVAGAIWKSWTRAAEFAPPDSLLGREPWLANTAPAIWPLIAFTISALAMFPLLRGWVRTDAVDMTQAAQGASKTGPL